jgi:putative transposase
MLDAQVRAALRLESSAQPIGSDGSLASRRDCDEGWWQAHVLWRAVDDEGEVLDVLLQKRRNKGAAMKLLRKLLKNTAIHPETIVTDELASYRATMREMNLTKRHCPGGMRANNRAENSHLPIRRRERKQQKFKSQGSAQRFLSTHAEVYNNFNVEQHLISRPTLRHFRAVAHQTWAAATTAA